MATSTSFSTITSLLYELSSSLYYQWGVFFFTLFSIVYVCFFLLMCVCVCSPTFFLSSCEVKDKLSHSLFQAHMKIRRASLHYWRSMVCVCEAHHWSLKCPWCLVCMHRSEIVDECCLECSSGLANASLHLIEWGNEKYLCVCFGVCVCMPGVLVDHNRSLFSLRLRRASMLTNLGRVLGLTRDSNPYCWSRPYYL